MPAPNESQQSALPWLQLLLQDPSRRTRELVHGYADLGPFNGASVPDAARALFLPLGPESDELEALDRSLCEFLLEERSRPVQLSRSGRKALIDSLNIVSALKLKMSAAALRRDIALWLSWAEAHSSERHLDLRAQLFTTWALTQRLPSIDVSGLEPFWLRVCEQAGEGYPATYLSIGLLGLRSLPERPDCPSERLWMAGLLRWAIARSPATDAFTFQWRALRALYPRTNTYWRTALLETLRSKEAELLPAEIRDRWTHDVGIAADAEPPPADSGRVALGSKDEVDALLQRMMEPISQLSREIDIVVGKKERYAKATGNFYFVAATACNIGMRLLRHMPEGEAEARSQHAIKLARLTLDWDPDSVYGWALWRDALKAGGFLEAAELVGWEAMRRFPENEQWRNQLASLLLELGRVDETRELLNETISRFPRDRVARSQLAELYLSTDRAEDVAAILQPALDQGFADAAVYAAKARAAYVAEGSAAALSVLSQGLLRFPLDEVLLRLKTQLEAGVGLLTPVLPQRPVIKAMVNLPYETLVGGKLRRVEAKIKVGLRSEQDRKSALSEVQSQLERNPHSEYAAYVLTGIDDAAPYSGFASAFKRAIVSNDTGALSELKTSHPERERLLDVAQVFLTRDQDAAQRVCGWLQGDGYRESRSTAALRQFLTLRMGERSNQEGISRDLIDRATVISTISGNDNVQLDLVEAAVASLVQPLAA